MPTRRYALPRADVIRAAREAATGARLRPETWAALETYLREAPEVQVSSWVPQEPGAPACPATECRVNGHWRVTRWALEWDLRMGRLLAQSGQRLVPFPLVTLED